MTSNLKNSIETIPGFRTSGISCGIKPSRIKDLAIIVSDVPAVAAGVFTKNRLQSPSVVYSKKILRKSPKITGIIVNSGNANACTGPQGLEDCKMITKKMADILHIPNREIVMASTGIIGVPLPRQTILNGIPKGIKNLSEKGWKQAAQAIMTTDLVSKSASTTWKSGRHQIALGGIAKGSGMINPNMATMLAFVVTNAAIQTQALKTALNYATDQSFNAITVDGECSTNDCVITLANGLAGNPSIEINSKEFETFTKNLTEVCKTLAKKIVEDGEGATKFVTINVKNAATEAAAKQVAMTVADSKLVKTALFGEDPNWGRIFAAVGYSGVPIRPERVDIKLGGLSLVKNGTPLPLQEKKIKSVMKKKNIHIEIALNQGAKEAEIYTCDLSYDYVKINSEYTT